MAGSNNRDFNKVQTNIENKKETKTDVLCHQEQHLARPCDLMRQSQSVSEQFRALLMMEIPLQPQGKPPGIVCEGWKTSHMQKSNPGCTATARVIVVTGKRVTTAHPAVMDTIRLSHYRWLTMVTMHSTKLTPTWTRFDYKRLRLPNLWRMLLLFYSRYSEFKPLLINQSVSIYLLKKVKNNVKTKSWGISSQFKS